jgi:hypothetical protein
MPVKISPSALPPECPKCGINMLVVDGYGLEPDRRHLNVSNAGTSKGPEMVQPSRLRVPLSSRPIEPKPVKRTPTRTR